MKNCACLGETPITFTSLQGSGSFKCNQKVWSCRPTSGLVGYRVQMETIARQFSSNQSFADQQGSAVLTMPQVTCINQGITRTVHGQRPLSRTDPPVSVVFQLGRSGRGMLYLSRRAIGATWWRREVWGRAAGSPIFIVLLSMQFETRPRAPAQS